MKKYVLPFLSFILLAPLCPGQKAEKKVFKTCGDVVTEILTTSPVFLKKTKGLYEAVVKNGGTSFGIDLEGSPNPKIDNAWNYSKTYDFQLHESYPDHMPVIARFTFDPTKKQLYQMDVAADSLIPIGFDKSLLLVYTRICK